ncbi:MAG: tetratricopeptide repeat protein [bacterium]|nr:tetratricopeptide repeat protein [bacterium]
MTTECVDAIMEGEYSPLNEWMDAEARVESAHRHFEQGRWPEAAAELRAAIDINPHNAAWHYNLGLTLEAMEDFVRAGEALQRATELEPDDIEILNSLGVNLTRQGMYAESLAAFGRIEKHDPTYEPSYCNRIITYTEMAQHDKAELMFYLARQVKDECALCYYNMGNSLYARKEYDRAIDCWKQTLRLEPNHRHANSRIAEVLWAKGDLAGASKYYEAELKADVDDVETLLDYGEMLMDLGQLDEARQKFVKALEIDPDDAAALFCLGELAMNKSAYGAAERHFRRALKSDFTYPLVHARLAGVLLKRGHVQEASRHLLYEIKHAGNDIDILHELGHLLLEAKLIKQANSVLTQLVALVPGDAHARHNLAVSYFQMNNHREGIKHCREALKIKPDYVLAFYNLALAHLRIGEKERARRYASRAYMLAPGDESVRGLSRRIGISHQGFWSKLRSAFRFLCRSKKID